MRYLTIIIAITGICFFACKPEKESMNTTPKATETHVKIHRIESVQESDNIQVLGIIMSESEARPSFKTGGIIKKMYVKEGDIVSKGQLLATLEMDEIEAQVRQAEEGLSKALRDKNRIANLYRDSVATLEQMQNVTTTYEVAKRTSEIALFNRKHSEVRSPISGKVIKQILYGGEVTGPGNPVYAILGVGKSDWVIKAGLTDRDWARVKTNDQVSIKLDAYPGQSFNGVITEKSAVGGNASGTFDVNIRFINQPKNLAAGLVSNLTIKTGSKENFTVIPIEALIKSNGNKAYVFTAENGKAKQVEIIISKFLGERVAVSSGLENVTNVITIGAMYLEDGDKISY
jgi:membrane fusion protein, multidrug efflux system